MSSERLPATRWVLITHYLSAASSVCYITTHAYFLSIKTNRWVNLSSIFYWKSWLQLTVHVLDSLDLHVVTQQLSWPEVHQTSGDAEQTVITLLWLQWTSVPTCKVLTGCSSVSKQALTGGHGGDVSKRPDEHESNLITRDRNKKLRRLDQEKLNWRAGENTSLWN